jgi:hypothetical protein
VAVPVFSGAGTGSDLSWAGAACAIGRPATFEAINKPDAVPDTNSKTHAPAAQTQIATARARLNSTLNVVLMESPRLSDLGW